MPILLQSGVTPRNHWPALSNVPDRMQRTAQASLAPLMPCCLPCVQRWQRFHLRHRHCRRRPLLGVRDCGGLVVAVVHMGGLPAPSLCSAGPHWCCHAKRTCRVGTFGQLGNDKVSGRQVYDYLYLYDKIQENAPVAVAQGSQRFVALSASVSGPPHACALNATGHALCWGDARIDVWDAGAVPKPTPVPGQPAGGFRAVTAAEANCGLAQATGQAFCFKWGERSAALFLIQLLLACMHIGTLAHPGACSLMCSQVRP